MALVQGFFDWEGRVLEKVDRIAHVGFDALDAGSEARATSAFLKALSLLEVRDPASRLSEFSEAFALVGSGLLRVRRVESAQAAATRSLTLNGGNGKALALQGDILVAQAHPSDALTYYEAGLRLDPKAKVLWQRKGLL